MGEIILTNWNSHNFIDYSQLTISDEAGTTSISAVKNATARNYQSDWADLPLNLHIHSYPFILCLSLSPSSLVLMPKSTIPGEYIKLCHSISPKA